MTKNRQTCLTLAVLTATILAFSAPAWSRESPAGKKLPELWEDFLYYIKVAQPVAAQSWGQAILASDAAPREVYLLAARNTVQTQDVLARGERLDGMKDVIAQMRKVIREGLRAEASSPEQIAMAMEMIAGDSLQRYQNGLTILKRSGEYALPQLLQKLAAADSDPKLRERIRLVLPQLGKDGVRGLSAALQSDDPELLEAVAEALGRIRYPHATPRLKELAVKEGVLARVAEATLSAAVACGGQEARKAKVSDLFYELAEKYYYQAESLRADDQYDTANVWYWQKDTGLSFKVVPRAIFCDIYAMRMARLALTYNQESQRAVSLWLAANLRREGHLPAGVIDPTLPTDAPGANYYTLAAGPRYLLDVLARGLKDGHSEVAAGAIKALARTSGAVSLVGKTADGIRPLVAALTFPDRHVRFLAAVSIGDALPQKAFEGSQLTVAILSEALRQKGRKVALVAMAGENVNKLIAAVREAGYHVITAAGTGEALAAGRKANGVDLVVLGSSPNPLKVIPLLRDNPDFAAVPVLVTYRTAELRRLADTDTRMVLIGPDAEGQAIAEAAAEAAGLGIGAPLTGEQADQWIIKAAGTVAMLGSSGNEVLNVSRTLGALTEALQSENAAVKIAVMEALSVINAADAQTAIVRVGTSSEIDEAVRLKALASLSASVRRYGNLLADAEIQAVLAQVSSKGSGQIRDGAAQALGALNLPSEKVKSLILGAK